MPIVTLPLLGYGPDLDPETPGVFASVNQMEATRRGWRLALRLSAAVGQATAGYTVAANSYALDGFRSRTTAGTEVLTVAYYDATATKVKLLVSESNVFVDESRGAFYTLTDNMSFCQYGDYTLATNLTDVLQIRDATTANSFADSAATGIPKAKICVTAGPHSAQRVVLCDYNDGTAYRDGVWWSSYGGPTAAWTADIATGAGYNRLLGCGIIQAACAYGDDIVIWGARSTWLGRFTGPPELMQFYKLSDEIGCYGPSACKVVGGVLYWVGSQGIFQFNGQSIGRVPWPIQTEVTQPWGSPSLNGVGVQLARDDGGERLILCAGRRNATTGVQQDAWSVNLVNGKVGSVGRILTGTAYQAMTDGPYYIAYKHADTTLAAWAEGTVPITGTLGTTGFELSHIGSNKGDTLLRSVIPRFVGLGEPGSFQCEDQFGPTSIETDSGAITAVTVTATPWRADFRQAARWHVPELTFTYNEDFEVVDVLLDVEKVGDR